MIACLAIHLAAILIMSAYYASGNSFGYTDQIAWSSLLVGLSKLSIAAIGKAIGSREWLLLAFIVAGLFLVGMKKGNPRGTRSVFFLLQPLIFYNGLVGVILLFTFPFEIFGLDEEWLAENSPALMSLGFWIIASVYLAVRGLRQPRQFS